MFVRVVLLFSVTAVFSVLFSSAGFAADDTVVGNSLCNVVSWMSGKTGRALVVLAMVITGILALLNKISWNVALIHLVGEALLLKASDMVTAISAGGEDC